MALNFPGPYVWKIYYTALAAATGSMQHVQNINIDLHTEAQPGDEFTQLSIKRRNGNPPGAADALDVAAVEWTAYMAGFFHTSTNIDFIELWKMTPGTTDGTFISAFNIDIPGTSASPTAQASQTILTFRTLEGGTMQIHFMECVFAPGAGQSLGVAGPPVSNLRDFVLSTDNFVLGKDTSYPFAPLRFLPGQSEALFKKRFRTN